jgi:hypothetical protein
MPPPGIQDRSITIITKDGQKITWRPRDQPRAPPTSPPPQRTKTRRAKFMDKIMHGVKRFLQVERRIKATKVFNTGVSANNGLMRIARNIWGLEPPGKKECGHRCEQCERERDRKGGHGRPEGCTLYGRGGQETGFRTKRMRRCSQEDGGCRRGSNVLMSDSDLLTGPSEREARGLEERTQRMIAPSMTEGSRPVRTRLEKLKRRSCGSCCSDKAKWNQNQGVGHEGWVTNLIHMRSHSQESLVEVIVKDHQESPVLKPTLPVPPNTPDLDKDQLSSGLSSIGGRTSNADGSDLAPFELATKSHIQQFLRTMNSSPAEVSRFSISEDSNDDEQHPSKLVIAPDDHISELELPPSEDLVLDSPTRADLEAALKEAMETSLPLPGCSTIQTSATTYHTSEVNDSRKIPEIPGLPELLTTKSFTPARPSLSISSASSNPDPTLSLLVEETIARPSISIASTSSNPDPPLSLLVEKPHCYCLLGSSYLDIEEDLRGSSSSLPEKSTFNYPPLDSSATTSEFGFEPTCTLMPGSWLESPSHPPEENGERKSWKDIISTFIPLAPSAALLLQTRSSIRNESPNVSTPESRLSLEKQRSLSQSSLRSGRRCSFEERRPFSPFSPSPTSITAGGSNNLHLRGGGEPSRFSLFRRWGAGKIEGNAARGRKLLDQKISKTDCYFVGAWGQDKTWREFGMDMEKRCEEGHKVEKERKEKEESEISRWESFVLFLAVLAMGPKKRTELVGAEVEVEVVGAEV